MAAASYPDGSAGFQEGVSRSPPARLEERCRGSPAPLISITSLLASAGTEKEASRIVPDPLLSRWDRFLTASRRKAAASYYGSD